MFGSTLASSSFLFFLYMMITWIVSAIPFILSLAHIATPRNFYGDGWSIVAKGVVLTFGAVISVLMGIFWVRPVYLKWKDGDNEDNNEHSLTESSLSSSE